MSNKKFLDTVHGYISVPDEYCEKLIDTKYFQRLRRIEQTSTRSLFPCAHHDRFVHSLGVFHIGQKIVESINKQIEVNTGITSSYLIACLLHDCGHSPFSHTFEHLFGKEEDLFNIYKEELRNRGIDEPLLNYDIKKSDAKPHEIISAYMCLKVFYEKILELGGNPALVGRMIIGVLYEEKEKSLENCFISLLHGDVIDADRLDYVCRDKWASGYLSHAVDLDRLISAIRIKCSDGVHQIKYRKNAINEIQSLIDSKNFQSSYVFTHHQVVYEQMLLQESVKELIASLLPDTPNSPEKLFNYKALFTPQQVNDTTIIYLPSDDDIVHLMKTHSGDIPHLEEWLSREYKYYPLWKTRSEFISLFKSYGGKDLLNEAGLFDTKIAPAVETVIDQKCIVLNGNPKIKKIARGQILIEFDSNTMDILDLCLPSVRDVYKDQVFKYVFVPNEFSDKRSKIIKTIKDELKKSIPAKKPVKIKVAIKKK